MKVYVIIKNGTIIDMLAENETVEADIVDLDTCESYEKCLEFKNQYDKLLEKVRNGELVRI